MANEQHDIWTAQTKRQLNHTKEVGETTEQHNRVHNTCGKHNRRIGRQVGNTTYKYEDRWTRRQLDGEGGDNIIYVYSERRKMCQMGHKDNWTDGQK